MIFGWSRDNTQKKKKSIFMNIKLQKTQKEKNHDFSQWFIKYRIGMES